MVVLKTGSSCELVSYTLDDWSVLAISFFDDVELAVLLQSPAGERYLGTVEYTSAAFTPVEHISSRADLVEALSKQASLPRLDAGYI